MGWELQSKGIGAAADLMQRSVSAVRVALVEPAATFTNTTPSSSGGGTTTTLTSAGAHGLTAAVSVGASIYISAGTGWTAGFYTITALDVDTTGVAITINVPFSAGFGTPTIALANTEVTLSTIVIPPLNLNSYVTLDWSNSFTSSGNAKTIRVKYGGSTGITFGPTTVVSMRSASIFSNRGATNSQLWTLATGLGTGGIGYGTAASSTTTTSVDSTISQNMLLTAQPAVANEVIVTDRYIVFVWR